MRHKLNKPILTSISTLIISDWSKSVGFKSSILLLFLNPNLTSFYLYLLNLFKFKIWKESLSSRYCEKWAQRLCYRPCNMKNDHSCYASPFNAKDKIYFLHSFYFLSFEGRQICGQNWFKTHLPLSGRVTIQLNFNSNATHVTNALFKFNRTARPRDRKHRNFSFYFKLIKCKIYLDYIYFCNCGALSNWTYYINRVISFCLSIGLKLQKRSLLRVK